MENDMEQHKVSVDGDEFLAGLRNELATMTDRALIAEARLRSLQRTINDSLTGDSEGEGSDDG